MNQNIQISLYRCIIEVSCTVQSSNACIQSSHLFSFVQYRQLPVMSDSGPPCVSFITRIMNQNVQISLYRCIIQVSCMVQSSNACIQSSHLFSFLQYRLNPVMSDSSHPCISFITRIMNQNVQISLYRCIIQVSSMVQSSYSCIQSSHLFSFVQYRQIPVMSDSGHPCVSFITRIMNQIIQISLYKSIIQVSIKAQYANSCIQTSHLFSFLQYRQIPNMNDSGHPCVSFITRIMNQIIQISLYRSIIQVSIRV